MNGRADPASNAASQTPPSQQTTAESGSAAAELGDLISLREANHIVKNAVIRVMAAAWIPVPLVDVAVTGGATLLMIRDLCVFYETPFDRELARAALGSLATIGAEVTGAFGLSSAAKLIPGFGVLAGGLSLSLSAGAFTYATGQVFIRHFEGGGRLLSFNLADYRQLFSGAAGSFIRQRTSRRTAGTQAR